MNNVGGPHPLTNSTANHQLRSYEIDVKGKFDQIVPLLKRVSELQHKKDFVLEAQKLALSEVGFELPSHGIGEEDNLRHNNVTSKCSQNFQKQTNNTPEHKFSYFQRKARKCK